MDRPRPHDHPASLDDDRLLAECDQSFLRRSGPGGQNRNKVETAVVLRHRPTGLIAEKMDQVNGWVRPMIAKRSLPEIQSMAATSARISRMIKET